MNKTYKLHSLSQIGMFAIAFFRSIIIARILGVEDFGIASTFSLILAFIEMSSELAMDKYIVQKKTGQNYRIVENAHFVMVVRGIVLSVLLFFLSPVFANLFSHPDLTRYYQVLALSPLIRGFVNFDFAVKRKNLNFTANAIIDFTPQLLSFLVSIIYLYFYKSYTVIIVIAIANSAFYVFFSHLLASRKYRLAFRRATFIASINFSAPLMLNGLLIFFVFQGDRLLVGANYSAETLGLYTALFSILNAPIIYLNRILDPIFLANYAKYLNSRNLVSARKIILVQKVTVISLFAIFIMSCQFLLPYVINHTYGADFIPSNILILFISISQAFLLLRMPLSTIAIGNGNTKVDMYTNMARFVGLIASVIFINRGYDFTYVAIGSVIGEVVSLLCAALLVNMKISQESGVINYLATCLLTFVGVLGWSLYTL